MPVSKTPGTEIIERDREFGGKGGREGRDRDRTCAERDPRASHMPEMTTLAVMKVKT